MSIRRRFLLILAVAVIALAAVALGLLRSGALRQYEQANAAAGRAAAAAQILARSLAGAPVGDPLPPGRAGELRALAADVVAPLDDASAGVCSAAGELLVIETVVPAWRPGGPVPPPGSGRERGLLELDRDAVQEACRAPRVDGVVHRRVNAPTDLLFITVQGEPGRPAAWALVRVRAPRELRMSRRTLIFAAGIGALIVLLVTAALQTLAVLRRGSGELRSAVVTLADDLHASVPEPEVNELRAIADGLRAMAKKLVDARDREHALERRLHEEQRLAGLGRVVAGVAHEVRNPLAALKLSLDRMARRALDERSARDVGVCLEEIARLDKVVGSMLLVARSEPPAKAPVDLGELTDERLRAAEALAAPRGVRLVRAGEAVVDVNRGHFTRVIDNLVRNAIEASPDGAEVRVAIERGGEGVTLAVEDAGPGVPEERAGELFEPFFTLRPDGTGLGLFLSRSLVEAHGGRLLYHREGGATRFVVLLPLQDPHGRA